MLGINDADYVVKPTVNGVRQICPYYRRWRSMFDRCYGRNVIELHPTYVGCTICDEWVYFTKFKSWVISQEAIYGDLSKLHLDKDILAQDGKHYSPETCCFVSKDVNLFLTDTKSKRGEYPMGVSWHKSEQKFRALVNAPDGKGGYKQRHLGHFTNPDEAHLAWKIAKFELACNLAAIQINSQIAEALIKRYTYEI